MRSAALVALAIPWSASAAPVLWYHGNGGTTTDTASFESHVTGTLGSDIDFEDDWQSVTLTDYPLVILGRPTTPFDAGQLADLNAYVANDGVLVLAGDSLVAGQPQIDALNGVLTGLGLSMQLASEGILADTCSQASVINGSDYIASSNPLSVLDMGDVDPGLGAILLGYSATINGVQVSADLVVEEGGVLLTADYDFYSGDTCGEVAKAAFWTSLWGAACDRDDDGVLRAECNGLDCDDTDALIGAVTTYPDLDGDTFGDEAGAEVCGTTGVLVGGDCDDGDDTVNPEGTEVCDGVDNNCSGVADDGGIGSSWFADSDEDGFGDEGTEVVACDAPSAHVADSSDCDDSVDTVNPGVAEVCSNGVDDNCDGSVDEGCFTDTGDGDPKPCGGCATPGSGGVFGGLVLAGLMVRRRGCR